MWLFSNLLKLSGGAARKKFQDDEKPFLDHLEDLRKTLMKIIATVIVSTLLAFLFYKQLIGIINYPIVEAGYDAKLLVLSPFEGFMSVLKVCLYAGLVGSFPLILYFIGEFVIPGLNKKEKKLIIPVVIASFALFASGVLFAYFVAIPRALEFFQTFNAGVDISTELRFKYTVSFVTMLCLAFGLCFELPVVVMTLVKLDLLNSRMMRNTRSYAIVAMFIVAAIITPTPDIATMSLLAGPMILLYEICIWLAWWLERKAAKIEKGEKQRETKALVERQKRSKSRAAAAEAEESSGADSPGGTLEYDPANQAKFEADDEDEDGDDNDGDSDGDDDDEPDPEPGGAAADSAAEDQSSDIIEVDDPASAAHDAYHTGLEEAVESGSDAVWKPEPESGSGDAGHGDSEDSDQEEYDPHHYDHHYHDDYYSGPTEELKRMLSEELKSDLKETIKQELRDELKKELLDELRKELGGKDSEPED